MFLNALGYDAAAKSIIKSRAEPSRAEPSRAEPSRAEPSALSRLPGRVMPRLSGGRSGRPPESRPSAPPGAQSDPLPTDPLGTAPSSRRREPTAGVRRRAVAGALAFVLLGFAALLATPQAAHAQVVKEIWSATLTTGASSTVSTVFGYETHVVTTVGSLSPDSISGLGGDRTVQALYNNNASGGTLTFGVGHATPDPLSNETFRARLTLHIGMTDSFAGAAATHGFIADGLANGLIWSSSGLTWAANQTSTVRLTLSVPGIDSIAFNSAGPDNTFDTGDAVTATVTFSEAVDVDVSGGTPQLTINVGGTDKVLDYNSGSGTTALVFSVYTVAFGDTDTDGLSIAADKLDLNGGTIKATADANPDAVLTHDAVGDSASHKVSATTVLANPTVDLIAFYLAGDDGAFKAGDVVSAAVTFDESVTVDTTGGTPQLTINVGGSDKVLRYSAGSPGTALVFSGYTVAANDEDTDGISIAANKLDANGGTIKATAGANLDAVLTHAAVAASASHRVDGVKPTLSSANASGDLTKVVLTFSEAIGTVDNTKITVKKGGTDQTTTGAAIDSANSTKVEITLTTAFLSTDTNITVELTADAVKDVPGNGIDAVSPMAVSLVDTTAPTLVSVEVAVALATLGTGLQLIFDETIDSTSIPGVSAFTVKVEGNSRTPTSATRSVTRSTRVVLNLATAEWIKPGETVTVSYAKPGMNPLKDAADNEVESFTDEEVANNIPATAPEAPGNLAASPGTDAGTMALSWDTPWHNGSDITEFEVRYAAGISVPPATTWDDITNSNATTTSYTVTGLTAGTEYTFEVRAVNGIGNGAEASVTKTVLAPVWAFTLTDSSNNPVTELTEGGDPATATVKITNSVRFNTNQTVTLEWGTVDLMFGAIVGAGGATTITITAGQSSGSLEISSPQRAVDTYDPSKTLALTATHGGTQIGSIDLTRLDDEDPPVATITDAPTTVNEGENIEIEISLNLPFFDASLSQRTINFAVTDADGALSGTLPTILHLTSNEQNGTITLTTADNSVQNDGAREVTFALALNPDSPYTLDAEASSVTVEVLDNDTPPTAPRNLTAQAGDTEATLRWDPPLPPVPDHGQRVSYYQYRVKAGTDSFGNWTTVPDSGPNDTGHTFTGLTNGTQYTYEVRAVNIAGGGAEASTTVTPIAGVAVSFAVATLSVDEGETVTVTVTLAEAPTPGTTVTVPIVATRGAGLEADEYSDLSGGSVIFGSGDVSQSFTVTTVEDTADEPDAVLTLTFGPLPAGYIVGTHAELALTVVDDDHPIVSATFDRATATVSEGGTVAVTVNLSQAPEREVVLPLVATRGANFAADEVAGVPASVTIAADATQAGFTVTVADDAEEEGNETLTLTFGPRPAGVTSGANPQLVLTVTDDDGPPPAPDVSVRTGDGYAALSWAPVANDSPVTRYEVRWRESDGGTFGAWKSVGLDTSYRVEGLANGKAYEFEVRAVNAHGDGEWASAPGTPTARLTGIPKAVQVLRVKATDSGRAELSWTRPANGTDRVTANSATATFAQLQGYRIEVCRTPCDDWYAVVPNTRKFEHKYVHQVLAPGVIRENRYRVQAININGKTGPWSNVATLDPTVVENFRLQTPDDSTLWVRFRVRNPDGNKLYVRYTNTGTDAVAYTERRLRKKGDVKLDLTGLAADSWYRVDLDFSPDFDSPRKQSRWYGTARAGETPLTSPYAVDALDAEVFAGGQWRDASDNELYVRMGGTGRYRVRLKPCDRIYNVHVNRIQAPVGRLRASPTDTDPSLFTNLNCKVEGLGYRTDEHGNRLTMDQVYDMTNFQDRAKDHIPIYGGTPNDWYEVTVTARALEDYPADRRHDALLSAPFAVVYNHEVWYGWEDTRSGPVSEGTGLVRVSLDRPADATLPEPSGVTIARASGASGGPVMRWDAVPGATGYKVEWRHGVQYSTRANQNRSLVTATSVTLPLGGSWRGPITARVRAYSSSGVSGWVERTWDSRPPTLDVFDTAVNEADGSVGFLVTLSPAASGQVTVAYTTVDDTAVAGTDYTATNGTVTFTPGQTRKSTAQVPITNDGEEDSGETFRLVLSNPAGSDANNGAAVLGDADAVATILNSEQEPAELTGFTLVDAGTNGDLQVLAAGTTVALGEWLAPSYGIRAETGPGAAPGSVRLALSGAKTVTYTDDAAPYSLYGDGAGRVNGEALPPGAYTLRATAYADSGGRGEERGSLEVAFTVTAGALGVTTPGPFPVAEGTTAVTTLGATQTGTGEAVSWSIPEGTAGGADGAAFALTTEGVLSLVAAKDFEAPDDADGDGTYEVTVAVREGAQTATAALSVTLADVEEVPLAVTTPGPFTVAEGTTAVAELEGSETGTGAAASWSIPAGTAGGADGAAFTLTPEGVLSLTEAKDFETPDDADGDGTYEVTVAVAVPAAVAAGAQRATAALLVTLADVNEAPVATATAARERVREGAEVTLDGSASTDPDASDTLSHAWTQIQDGGPRVTLSDATAAQPVFTSPSDLAAETELAFTLRVTDAEGLYAEDTVTVTVSLISEVSIGVASAYAAEGADAVFRLTRAGSALKALTVPVTVEETGAMLGSPVPPSATFAAGAREAELRVPTAVDAVSENDSLVTVRLGSGPGWQLAPDGAAASLTVLDDDVAPSVSAADVTIWSADMTVVEYGPRSIGAGSAAQFSNQMGRAGLRAKWLWYDPVARKLKLGFDDSLDDAEALTLHVGAVSLGFPANSGGDSSFSLEHVDIAWTDGETLAVRVSKPSAEAVSTDATLATLTVAGATLSPAFDAGVLVYRAVADAETVTLAATATDGGAAVTYGPAADADAELAHHQVAAPEGETLVAVTVTAADGTVRRYRVVVAQGPATAQAVANTAPTGRPVITGTETVGEELSASTETITDADGLDTATFTYQWLANDGTEDTAIDGATEDTWTLTPAEAGKTITVRVTFTDDKGTEETLVSEAPEPVAAVAPSAPVGLAAATAEDRERELTVSWSAPESDGGSEVTGYRVQWKSGTEAYDGSQTSARQAVLSEPAVLTHTIAGIANGTAYTVRVLAVNAAGAGAAAEAGATVEDRVVPVLTKATVDGATLTLTYSEALDQDSAPSAGTFAVTVTGAARTVDGVALSERAVVLTLASGVVSGETVTVGYTVPTGSEASPLRDAAGNDAAGFTGAAATNETEASNAAPAGLPEVSGTAEVGEELTVSVDDIADADGLETATFTYRWLADDGTVETAIAGATGESWTLTAAEAGRTVRVRVTYTDDKGTQEVLTSAATETVVDRRPVAATLSVGDGAAEAGRFRLRIAFADAVTGLGAADVGAARVGGDAAAVSELAEAETGRVWTAWVAAAEAGRYTVRLAAGAAQSGARQSLASVLAVDVDAAGNAASVAGPVVTAVALAPAGDGSRTDGDEVRVTLAFSVAVTVDTAAGTPSVGIGLDGDARQAAYASGTGTASLVFVYAVTGDDGTVSAVTVTADSLAVNGGTIRDADGRDANLAHPGDGDASAPEPEEAAVQEAESDPVAASEVVVDPDALTASFTVVPAAHGGPGSGAFVLELAFSEEPELSYSVLRNASLAATGGRLGFVRRLNPPLSTGWKIKVRPSGWDDVTVTLAGGRACGTSGAVCTEDGKVLANTAVAVVPGPLALSVADAQVQEAANAVLAFEVTLNRAATGTVTVAYATADGTATSGADYTAASDTLTFQAGETEKTVDVAVLNDAHDDGGETLTLTLSDPTGARLRDAEATGTIENSGPIPKAWLARFGRTVAGHVVDAISGRLEDSPAGGSHVMLGGQRVALDGARNGPSSGGGPAGGGGARERAAAAGPLAAFAERMSDGGAGAGRANWGEGGGEDAAKRPASRTLGGRDLLLGSSFLLRAGDEGDEGAEGTGTAWTAWGRAAVSRFDGEADGLTVDGDVTTLTLGADTARGGWLGGVALARSLGDGGFRDHPDSDLSGSGTLKSTLSSVHPYLRFRASERLTLWGVLGYGTGDLTLEMENGERWTTDTGLRMAAAGARGVLVSAADTGGFELASRGDARFVRMRSDAVTAENGPGHLAATDTETSRLRFILEGSHRIVQAGGRTLTPSLEAGLRHDGGDAETGTGIEVGGGVSYADPARGLTVTAKARGLLAHEDTDYREWGVSGAVRIDPGAAGRGLSLTLAPAWGADGGSAERLWSARDARALAANDAFEPAGRLEAEAGYGLAAFAGRGRATPFTGLVLSNAGDRTWRTGVRWSFGPGLSFGIEGARREPANDNEAEHEFGFKLTARW